MADKTGTEFSHSLTDLMAGVAVTFLLLAVIFMLQAANSKRRVEGLLKKVETIGDASRAALKKLVADLKRDRALANAVREDPTDPFTVTLEFPEETLYFPTDSFEITEEARRVLVPPLVDAVQRVCDIDAQLTNSIFLEGHTDIQGRLENNVRLSAQRAQTVYFEVRERLSENHRNCIDSRFTVSGRGYSQPKLYKGRWDDDSRQIDPADRRVVLKVRFTAGGEALARAER